MHDILLLIRYTRRRFETTRFLAILAPAMVLAAVLLLVLAVLDRLPASSFLDWQILFPSFLGAALVLAALRWMQHRMSDVQVAMRIDERLSLDERFTTALAFHLQSDPMAQAAVDDAVHAARDPRTRELLTCSVAHVVPRRWWTAPLIILLAAGVLRFPQAALFAEGDSPVEAVSLERAQQEVDETLQAVTSMVDEEDMAPEINSLLEDLGLELAPPDEDMDPADLRRDAIKSLTELDRRLDDLLAGDTGRVAKDLQQMIGQLPRPESPLVQKLVDAMAAGDYRAAQDILEQMLSEVEDGMGDEEREALASAMEELAGHLEEMAEQEESLRTALEQAGLNPDLAGNMDALEQALQQAEHLNDEQRQQLQGLIESRQRASEASRDLASACRQLGQCMQGKPGLRKAGQQMGKQLDDLEQLQMLLQQARAMQQQSREAAQGLGMAMQGWGSDGGEGHGWGGRMSESSTPWSSDFKRESSPIGAGEIIARMAVKGEPITGKAKSKLKEVIAAAAEGYDDAIREREVPRRYHEPFKHYFGTLAPLVESLPTESDDPTATSGEASKSNEGQE